MRAMTLALTIVFSIGLAAADNQWQAFRDPSGAFSVELPRTPKVQSSDIPTAAGTVHNITYTVELGGVAVAVWDTDFSGSPGSDPQRVVAGAVGGLKQGRKLLSESEDILDGANGHFIKVETDGTVLAIRVFFVKDHLYQVMTGAPGPTPTPEHTAIVDRFLRSFHFTKK